MGYSVTKLEFLERVRDTHERWEAAIQIIPKCRMIEPGFCGVAQHPGDLAGHGP